MNPMPEFNFKILETQKDLELYQHRTEDAISVKFPMDYLKRARVVGLKDNFGEIHGGFLMAYQGPLRALELLPQDVRLTHPIIQAHQECLFEINGLWLDHKKAAKNCRFHLYLHCMYQAIRLGFEGKTKYIYAYGAENPKLRSFYSNFNSLEIYEGPVRDIPGVPSGLVERVEMGCMKRLPITVLRNPKFLIQRSVSPSYNRVAKLWSGQREESVL